MSVQYLGPGFELTTSRIQTSSYNHFIEQSSIRFAAPKYYGIGKLIEMKKALAAIIVQ